MLGFAPQALRQNALQLRGSAGLRRRPGPPPVIGGPALEVRRDTPLARPPGEHSADSTCSPRARRDQTLSTEGRNDQAAKTSLYARLRVTVYSSLVSSCTFECLLPAPRKGPVSRKGCRGLQVALSLRPPGHAPAQTLARRAAAGRSASAGDPGYCPSRGTCSRSARCRSMDTGPWQQRALKKEEHSDRVRESGDPKKFRAGPWIHDPVIRTALKHFRVFLLRLARAFA